MQTASNILWKLLILISLLFFVAGLIAVDSNHMVQVELKVQRGTKNQLIAEFNIQNISEEIVWIFKYNLCQEGESNRKLFLINDMQGKEIGYIGRFVKIVPKPEHFIELPPGEYIKSQCRLDRIYDFLGNSGTYQIRYDVSNNYLKKDQEMELISNTLIFTY